MDNRVQVKQFVGKVLTPAGVYMAIFTTGDPKYLLFRPMDPTGQIHGTIDIPVKRTDLRRDWKRWMVV